jgi:hypothetical protein
MAGSTVNYQVVKGSGPLSSASPASDPNGFANTTLHLAALGGDVQVSACVAPGNKPCQIFSVTAVPAEHPDSCRGSKFQASDGAGHGFSDAGPSGTWRKRNLPGGSVSSGRHSAAGYDRRNCHHSKSYSSHRLIVTAGSAFRCGRTGRSSALYRGSRGSSPDPRHGGDRNQHSSLPIAATLAPASSGPGVQSQFPGNSLRRVASN